MKLRRFLSEGTVKLKVLCISFASDGKSAELDKTLKNVTHCGWEDLQFLDGEVYVKDEKLSKFQFIIVGAVGKSVDLHSALQVAAKNEKIPVFNYGVPSELNNKILQTVRMRAADVQQVKTIIAQAGKTSAGTLVRELKLPIVSKIVDGSQGRGVSKHDTKEDLEKFLSKHKDEHFIFQEFIPNDGDVRIFYVKKRFIYSILRQTKKEGEFRNNTSLGGEATDVKLEPEARKLADAACACMGFEITGVDLIQHKKTKKWYVMEINAAPQFKGDKIPDVIDAILEYVK